MSNKIRCHIVDCNNYTVPGEVEYIKVYKTDNKTLEGHRPICKDCQQRLSNYKKKVTVKFIYG